MRQIWKAVKRFRWAIYCASVAALDFTTAALTGRWINYAIGAVMVACAAISLYSARTRKATPAMATGGYINSSNWALLGYTSPPAISSSTPPTPSNSAPKEFAGLPFDLAIGEVYGLRMWRMDTYGRLRARNWSKAEPWRPGVNVAKCVERSDNDYGVWLSQMSGLTGMTPPKPTAKPPHDTPSESCACGFYAYTDSRHADTVSYKDSGVGPVLGIIKGTGRTLMGTQGFRCEKAEIVAFRDPTRGGTKDDPWRKEQLANLKRVYPDVPILDSREALLEFAPLTNTLPDPSTDEFWALP